MATDSFERNSKFYKEHGLGGTMGFGKKPALIVIDLQLGFTDSSCPLGGDLDQVVKSSRVLVDQARRRSIPVFFTAVAYEHHLKDAGIWAKTFPA